MSGVAVFGEPRMRRASSGCAAGFFWVFAAVWYGFIGTMMVVLFFSPEGRRWGPIAALGVFALAGLLVVWMAVRTTRSALLFRGTLLDLPSPGLLGGRISGAMQVPHRVLKADPLEFRVTSWRRWSESNDLLWETIEPVPRSSAGGANMITLPFSLRLPFDAQPTTPDYYWQLELRSSKDSVSFEVPVERTVRSDASQTMAALRPVVKTPPANAVAKIDRHLNGVDVRFPMPSWTLSWYASMIVLTAAAVFVGHTLPEEYRQTTYFWTAAVALFFFGFPLISLALIVRSIYADRAGVKISYALPMRKPVTVAASELKDVRSQYSASAVKYEIEIIRANGNPMIGSVIYADTREEGEWIAGELRRALFDA